MRFFPAIAWVILALVAAASAGADREPTEPEIQWLRQHAIAFETPLAGHGFADLQPLKAILGEARLVGLGEGTHGTREFFQMKHRLVEFLARELGFTIFSIEASTPEAYLLNDYVLHGRGDPKQLIGGMYFWTWNTEEVLDLVEWMRAYNASGEGRMQFTGFDMQEPRVAMENVLDFLARVDPEAAEKVRPRYLRLRSMGASTFGVGTWTFPVEVARRKHVRYSGWIKTENLEHGWAGLWWRVDGRQRGKYFGFDNMAERGPLGTTEWKEYAVELDVPPEATNINFGVLMPGYGRAWFDELKVELDGTAYDGSRFFDFEAGRLPPVRSLGNGYQTAVDSTQSYSGRHSLRIESEGDRDSSSAQAKEAVKVAAEILAELREKRGLYAALQPARDVDWAIHNARIVLQCMQGKADSRKNVRDESMAENVAWILEQNPGEKIVLWAHNSHVSRKQGWMGAHLARRFGEAYVPVAFTTGSGTYYAVRDHEGLGVNTLKEPPPGSIEDFFLRAGIPRAILDVRSAEPGSPASAWLTETRPLRGIGAMAMEQQFRPTTVADDFDFLIWFSTSQTSIQLETPPASSR